MSHDVNDIIQLYKGLTGRDVIPKDTDPKRTYQYRYAAKFMKNMDGVPWDTIKKIVYYAVEYAKENDQKSVYTRGLWILTKSNIVEIAYKRAKEENNKSNLDLKKLLNSKKFAQDNGYDLEKSEDGGFPNIVKWYDTGKISLTFLSMSESCKNAMLKLDDVDKGMLPNQNEITKRRIKCTIDREYCKKIKKILGSDYIKITKENKK